MPEPKQTPKKTFCEAAAPVPLMFLSSSGARPGHLKAQASWKAKDATTSIADVLSEFDAACALAARCGLSGNQLLLSASRAVAKTSGVDPLQLLGVTGLEGAHVHFTPRQLGRHLGMTAREVNLRLFSLGMQDRISGTWVPTEAGTEHAVLLDVGKHHGDGTPVTQLRWKLSILSVLDPADMLAAAGG